MVVATGAAAAPAWGQTAVSGSSEQQEAASMSTAPSIIPAPASMQMLTGPAFTVTPGTQIVLRPNSDAAQPVADDLAAILRPSTGYTLPVVSQGSSGSQPVAHSIVMQLLTDPDLGQEGYRLNVSNGLALMQANTLEGLFHGVQTLRQMLPPTVESSTVQPGPWTVPNVNIVDHPRFAYRGALLDVARHFFSVADVEHYIDLLSMYKINVLHLHLTDDQGWRIAINGLPQLTTIGGATEAGGGPGGFYTQQDYKDIVAFAAAHFMTVVPEIDMPGHVNAALTSIADLNCDGVAPPPYTGSAVGFSSLCIGKPITNQFITQVLDQIAAITPGPYIHIGGDEALSTNQTDYDTFENQVQPIVAATGKNVMGWEEIAAGNLPPNSVIQHWHSTPAANALALEGVAKGAKVVMSPSPLAYLNRDSSVQASYNWDPATFLNGVTEKDILGVEEDVWASDVSVTGYPKTSIDNMSDVEFLTLPRGLAIAEMGWTPQADRNFDAFKARVAAQEPRWQAMGLNYYRSPDVPWLTQLTLGNIKPLTAGGAADVTGTFTNNSDEPVSDVGVTLTTPQGWTVQPSDTESFSSVAPGSSANLSWHVTAPAGGPSGSTSLSATATYTLEGVDGSITAQAPVTVCSSMPAGDPTARGQWNFTIGCAADLSGNGHDGAAGTGVTFSSDTGAAFNGTFQGQITVPYSADYQPEAITAGQSWHLDLTGVVPSTINGQYQAIAIDRGPTANGWIIYETPTGGLQFWMLRAEDGKYPAANSGVTVVPGDSYNIDVGWDGTRLSISVTGAATHAGSTALGGTYGPVGNVPMRFGAGGDNGTTAFFTGTIQAAKITIN
jgi:N-acetyl-beta-hexosaminidase